MNNDMPVNGFFKGLMIALPLSAIFWMAVLAVIR